MNANRFLFSLRAIGFTENEAKLYCTLLNSPPLSGYAAALRTGMSRTRAYQTLDDMCRKGYATMEVGSPSTYAPVDISVITAQQEACDADNIAQACALLEQTPVFSGTLDTLEQLFDYREIMERLAIELGKAKNQVLTLMRREEYNILKPALERAAERGVRIYLIAAVPNHEPFPCSFAEKIFYFDPEHSRQLRQGRHWIWMAVDGSLGAMGILTESDSHNVILTQNQPFVHMIEEILKDHFSYYDFVTVHHGPDFLRLGTPEHPSYRFHLPEWEEN